MFSRSRRPGAGPRGRRCSQRINPLRARDGLLSHSGRARQSPECQWVGGHADSEAVKSEDLPKEGARPGRKRRAHANGTTMRAALRRRRALALRIGARGTWAGPLLRESRDRHCSRLSGLAWVTTWPAGTAVGQSGEERPSVTAPAPKAETHSADPRDPGRQSESARAGGRRSSFKLARFPGRRVSRPSGRACRRSVASACWRPGGSLASESFQVSSSSAPAVSWLDSENFGFRGTQLEN